MDHLSVRPAPAGGMGLQVFLTILLNLVSIPILAMSILDFFAIFRLTSYIKNVIQFTRQQTTRRMKSIPGQPTVLLRRLSISCQDFQNTISGKQHE